MTKRWMGALALVAAVVTPASPAGAQSTGTPDPGITKLADAYVAAVEAGDAMKIAMLYTEDAVEMAPGHPAIEGRQAIEEYYRKLFSDGATKVSGFTLTHLETRATGDSGYDVGTYRQTVAMGDKTMQESGKYVVIVKRDGGEWRVAYAIYNADEMPAMPMHH